jgi:sigma 54 modulation/S30EA-like ribosomal protein
MYTVIRLVMDEEMQFRSWRHEQFETEEDVTNDGKYVYQPSLSPEADGNFDSRSPRDQQEDRSSEQPDFPPTNPDQPAVENPDRGQAKPMSVHQALHKLEETGGDYVLFDDINSGQPTVVYRRVDAEHRVMWLAEPVKEPGPDALQMLSSSVLAQQPLHSADHTDKTNTHEESSTSETNDGGELDEFDEFLIIQSVPNPS